MTTCIWIPASAGSNRCHMHQRQQERDDRAEQREDRIPSFAFLSNASNRDGEDRRSENRQ